MKLCAQRVLLALMVGGQRASRVLWSPRALFLGGVGLTAYGVSFWSVGAALVTGGVLVLVDLRT